MRTGSASTGSSGSSATSTSTRTPDTHYHLHLERPHGEHVVLVSSEKLTDDEPWSEFGQDELLVCDPADPDHPRVIDLLGERADEIEFVPLDASESLIGGRARRVGGAAGRGGDLSRLSTRKLVDPDEPLRRRRQGRAAAYLRRGGSWKRSGFLTGSSRRATWPTRRRRPRRRRRARRSSRWAATGSSARSRRAARAQPARRAAGRPRQRLRARARDPPGHSRGMPRARRRRRAALDLGEANGRPFACIASTGLRLRGEPDRERGAARQGQPGLRLRRDPRADRLAARPLQVRSTAREHALRGLHGRGRQHRLLRRRHAAWRRTPTRPTACSRWSSSSQTSKLRFLANLPKVFSASTSSSRESRSTARARSRSRADRPFDVYADGEPSTTLPATVRLDARRAARDRAADLTRLHLLASGSRSHCAKAVGRLSRLSRRGGGTSLPGKLLLRLEPRRDRACSARQLERGSVVVSATNGKTTTAGMIASVLGAGRHRGRAQPRRREHAGRRRDRAARAARRARSASTGRARPVRGRRGLARDGRRRSSRRTRSCSATCSATSSTATASSSGWPTSGRARRRSGRPERPSS